MSAPIPTTVLVNGVPVPVLIHNLKTERVEGGINVSMDIGPDVSRHAPYADLSAFYSDVFVPRKNLSRKLRRRRA
jgi:hypothetical protein